MQTCCRICKNKNLITIMDFGEHALSCRFPFNGEPDPLITPLVLVKCNDMEDSHYCGLVQLKHNTSGDELYLHNYGYRSGLNKTMTEHLKSLGKECTNLVNIEDNDIILDIGSNDATLLKSYSYDNIRRIGIDPTGKQFQEFYTEDITLVPDYFSASLFIDKFRDEKAKIVTSISMFYDLPDPVQFARDIKKILHPNGIWVTEQSYIVSMLEKNSFDTVCHEHLEYYALKQLEYIANVTGLKIINVTLNECNGGSFRIFLTHKNNSTLKPNYDNIKKLKELEKNIKLDSFDPYDSFKERCDVVKNNLTRFLTEMKKSNKCIFLYGASTKGNTLLQYYNIDNKIVSAAAERNTEKFGRRTPKTDIPIIPESEMREIFPDFLLVLPWHFKDEFILREQEYLNNGGQIIFPLPELEIISNKKKAFITGVNGQIGHYLAEILLEKDYIVYGLLHNNKENLNPRINYLHGDLNDTKSIEQLIWTIKPDEIYNLGGNTDTPLAIKDPIQCFNINTNVVNVICETIYQIREKNGKNIKLFQAGSAEMYKGLLDGNELVVNEDNTNFYPITPYGVSKVSSYWTLKYYREKMNLYMCNGIVFNTESSHRHSRYLSKKISNFVRNMKDDDILQVGNLHCYRDFIHAYDAANAMYMIMQQDTSSDYIISSNTLTSIKDFICLFFKTKGIYLEWSCSGLDEKAHDISNGKVRIKINPDFMRSYEITEKLMGNNEKLKSIGWTPKYSVEDIVRDMLNI